MDYTTAVTWFFLGAYVPVLYYYLSLIEPYASYLPGGISQYYKVHKQIKVKFDDIIGMDHIKKEL